MSKSLIRRGSTWAATVLALSLSALGWTFLDAAAFHAIPPAATGEPALFNEARYARHAGQADFHAAFQDHPMALEHFPAGSLIPPPHAPVD